MEAFNSSYHISENRGMEATPHSTRSNTDVIINANIAAVSLFYTICQ